MAQQTSPRDGWFGRWREHRRVKRQAALERRFYHQERARETGIASPDEDITASTAYANGYPVDVAGPWGGMLHNVGPQPPKDDFKP